MVAFNFNINFQDEPSLEDGVTDTTNETITIVRSTDKKLFVSLPIKYDYVPMSGREACYGVDAMYKECNKIKKLGIDVKGLCSFEWSYGDRTLFYEPQEALTPELLQFWVLHTIIPMMLSIDRTYTFLHVGAVEVSGHCILFSAESFGGKSTLTDYFIQRGHTLFSDDALAIYKESDGYKAIASYPYHRPYREPESLGYKVTEVVKGETDIKVVYLLERCDATSEVSIASVKGVEKYRAMHYGVFMNFDCLKDIQFQELSDFVNAIPVYRVKVPWNLQRISEVYDAIIAHN